MRLDEWIFRNKKKIAQMARDLECSESGLANIIHGKTTPNVYLAIKIVSYTRGYVEYYELLSKADREEISKWADTMKNSGQHVVELDPNDLPR